MARSRRCPRRRPSPSRARRRAAPRATHRLRRRRSRRSGCPAAGAPRDRCDGSPADRARAAPTARRASPRAARASAGSSARHSSTARREAHDQRHRQRAGPQAQLVAAAVQQRLERHARRPAPHVERAHALRAVELVRAEREQVDAERAHVERQLADGLRRVAVQAARRAPGRCVRSPRAAGARRSRCSPPSPRRAACDRVSARATVVRVDEALARRRAAASPGSPRASSARQASSTAGCSVATVIRWSPRRRPARATPLSARLSLSVVPLVKTISRGSAAPIARAIRSRASSTAASARQPKACVWLEALPKSSPKYGSIASSDARIDGRGRVVIEIDRELESHRARPTPRTTPRSRRWSSRSG